MIKKRRIRLTFDVQCDFCGTPFRAFRLNLLSGSTQSCGCLARELSRRRLTTHGWSGSRTYGSWRAMIRRCEDPNNIGYKYYGGRSIRVCEQWRSSFQNFLMDMGERLTGMTLDRINTDGNYGPENCRWATAKEQQATRRDRVHSIGLK